jgi:hypothetical protein
MYFFFVVCACAVLVSFALIALNGVFQWWEPQDEETRNGF